jgi:uncharacterized membrane protein YbaN (DUF454 family)
MRILRYTAGVFFIVLGIVGLFLPVLQGILFILIGLACLFPENRYLQQLLQKARARYPGQTAKLDAWKERLWSKLRRSEKSGA